MSVNFRRKGGFGSNEFGINLKKLLVRIKSFKPSSQYVYNPKYRTHTKITDERFDENVRERELSATAKKIIKSRRANFGSSRDTGFGMIKFKKLTKKVKKAVSKKKIKKVIPAKRSLLTRTAEEMPILRIRPTKLLRGRF